ncbi:aminobenzoyl-glutamate transport protein [Sphingobium sp. B1D7B]|uniref:AbgT family transporter n=1 Tax=unclassified Sphingobium TaxID=2611147 RepID=UPI00222553C6|nr:MULTISPECIES: AbgT family transporter [unclassified Sphingobium]MCW2391761.1 aminobenzoyl-glutamate transport protein [Sphingobium sp. B11D3A]MCW2403516.1 aminobenzoyl-glutamate transport protein [Sphingobium sp. B1D7B]
MAQAGTDSAPKGILGWIERTGNKLPDPVFIFFYLILALVLISLVAALAGLSAVHPTQVDAQTGAPVTITAQSLLGAENIRRLWVEMPATFTHFHPLGYVLVVMLGAGVAERSGLFGTAMRASVANAPAMLLTPMVAFVAMMGNLAADAAYVVLVPLAGIIYAAAGRHPVAGIAAAFAGVSGGFSANLLPGQLDALLFGITQQAAQLLDADWQMNIAGNWFFMAALLILYIPVIWYVTDRIIEPRLGGYVPQGEAAMIAGTPDATAEQRLTTAQRKGLRHGGLAMLAVVALWAIMALMPGAPLVDANAAVPEARLTPFYQSLVGGFFLLFLAGGWAYGKAAGTIADHRDVVKMMSGAMGDLAYYLVLAFAAAHFVAMFGWSNLGLIFAIHGAGGLQAVALPTPVLLLLIVLFTTVLNLFVGSASAKWALLAPVLVPMLMLLGISAETTTAAYRVGDGATNIISPLMVYFPLILIYCQRWVPSFGLGSLAAVMLPYSLWLLLFGGALLAGWTLLDLPLGPNAPVHLPAVLPGS